jgi:hypothetical protein
MSARFRIVHFMPDLLSGARVPIAALIEREDRHVQMARADLIPGPAFVGGRAAWSSLNMALEDLTFATSFEILPRSIGPFVHMDEARIVPASVGDPVDWVRKHVLPRKLIEPEDQLEEPPPVPKRQVQGKAFLRTYKVARYVEDNFNGVDYGFSAKAAFHVSHWVRGSGGLLLMEPIVGSRDDFTDELIRVSSTFLAWRKLFENHRRSQEAKEPDFIAYVLDARRGESSTVREELKEARAQVVDVDVPNERDRFISRIREVGTSGRNQSELQLDS